MSLLEPSTLSPAGLALAVLVPLTAGLATHLIARERLAASAHVARRRVYVLSGVLPTAWYLGLMAYWTQSWGFMTVATGSGIVGGLFLNESAKLWHDLHMEEDAESRSPVKYASPIRTMFLVGVNLTPILLLLFLYLSVLGPR